MLRAFCVGISLLTLMVSLGHAEETTPPVKIGVIYGFTGAAQKWAEFGRKGIDLAVQEINSAGGINSRPLQVIYEDNQTDPKQSVSAYRKLVSLDNVDAIVASNWSILTNPLIPLSQQDKVIVISPTVMDASVESRSDYFFTLGYRVDSVRGPVRQFLKDNPDIMKVAFLCWDDAWGLANLAIWKEEVESKGLTVVDTICEHDYSSDFRTHVTKVSAKKPDAVFIGMYPERVSKRMKELGLSWKIFTTSVVLEVLGVPEIGNDILNGMYFAYWPPTSEFHQAFKSKYNEDPILEAHNHYEVIRSLARVLGEDRSSALSKLKNLHYPGLTGEIDFSHGPFANLGVGRLMKIENGAFIDLG